MCNTGTDPPDFALLQSEVFHQTEQTVMIKAAAKKTLLLQGFFGFESKTQITNLVSHPGT